MSGDLLTVREVLQAARDAAVEIRRLEEQVEIRRQLIGVQGHNSFEVHGKTGVLDPMRHVVELMDWQDELVEKEDLTAPIEDAFLIVKGISHISDSLTLEVVTRYYLQGESWREIVDGYLRNGERMPPIEERADVLKGVPRAKQFEWLSKAMAMAIENWERIGIAHLKEMGQA